MDNSVMDNVPADTNQVPIETSTPTEKVLTQSQVNEIVGRAKHDAVESFKRQQTQNVQPTQQTIPAHQFPTDEVRRVADDAVKNRISELERDYQERSNIEAANRVIAQYNEKIAAGKGKYQDYDNVTGNLQMQYYPNVVHLLAEQVDNSADVLYHLAANRDKLYRLESLSGHNPADAVYEIKRLSDSIKANEQTSNMKHANAPLSQMKPSNTGTDSGGALSFSDLKRKYRA